MGIFSKLFNQAKTTSLSPEEKKLDSILKEAANDVSVKLIPTDKKDVYEVDVTLENGKSISYYGKLRYSYGWERLRYLNGGIEDDKPYVNVSFVSNAFDNKEIQDSIIKDVIEWRRNEYGNQYNTFYTNNSENEIYFFIMGEGCFGMIPAIPDKYDSFKYADILEELGEVEADKRFCEFLSKKLSGYTSVMIKSLEYSLGCGHKWPTKDDIIAREKAQAAKEAAERKAKAQRARAYPGTMKKILTEYAKQNRWELVPLEDKNRFRLCIFEEGSLFLNYSTDVNNPTVDVEFWSFPFVGDGEAKRVGDSIADSRFGNDIDIYIVAKIQLKLKKTVALQNIEDETDSIKRIKDCVQSFINTVDGIGKNIQKWPTKAETEARYRELEEKAAAEERARRAREAAAQQAAEAEQRKQMIAKCKLNIGKLRAKVAECEADCTSHRGDDYYRRRRDDAKADLAKEKYKLQQLEAGEDLRFIHVY